MDWESLYCPNRRCRYYGRPFLQEQLVKHGSSHGQKQALCRACETSVSIRYGTTYLDLHADPPIFETAVQALAEGTSISPVYHEGSMKKLMFEYITLSVLILACECSGS